MRFFRDDILRLVCRRIGWLVLLLFILVANAAAQAPLIVRDIRVEGLQRISDGTVFNYLPVNIGDELNRQKVQEALRAVYATGFFKDVEFRWYDATLILAVSERPNTMSIRETTHWQEVRRLRHEGGVDSVTFSPDGQTMATGSQDGKARLWNVTSGEELFRMATMKAVRDLAFSPDGSRLAGGGSDSYAYIWRVSDGKQLHRIKHPLPWVERVVFSPSGEYLITVNGDGIYGVAKEEAVRLWDTDTAKELATIGQGKATDVAFSPNGEYLATAEGSSSGSSSAHLWDTATLKEVARFEDG